MNRQRQIEAAIRDENPTSWFEPLYRDTEPDGDGVPWANMATHPSFQQWLGRHDVKGDGLTAVVIGCGMGDDAVELASRGFQVTAFDVSESAIGHCRRRFPDAAVEWLVADLFEPPAEWSRRFDFVLEIYTIQALPPQYEQETLAKIVDLVGADGKLLVIAIVSDEPRSLEAGPPWLLTPACIESFKQHDLNMINHFVHTNGCRRGDVWISTFQRLAQ